MNIHKRSAYVNFKYYKADDVNELSDYLEEINKKGEEDENRTY